LLDIAIRLSGASPSNLLPVFTFHETGIPGVVVVESEAVADERGSFARTYCRDEFAAQGIDFVPVQISRSTNRRAGTLRGLHCQAPPRSEAKLISCTRGSAFDVAVDLRDDSPTYGRWTAVELSRDNLRSIYIPPGCAHGFQTLEDDTELLYLISKRYDASLQRGVRWDDSQLAIEWPAIERRIISERDAELPLLSDISGES
jgi:dTDP-4-dehydrorhamnose 3,5-epimerase